MLIVHWFLSKRVRHAVDACRQVRKLLRAQKDLLHPDAITRVETAVGEMWQVLREGRGPQEIDQALAHLEEVVQRNLRAYPNPRWRENIEVFLVTGAVVLALRTFFVQPMAIPTGSAQPTLWGITSENLANDPNNVVPGALRRWTIDKWWSGISYIHVQAKEDGRLSSISQPRLVFPFVRTQTLTIGNRSYRVFFPSSFTSIQDQMSNAGVPPIRINTFYRAGDEVVKLKVISGDHLFVNRMVYNFRPPHRGEIIVFSSEGLPLLMPNTHYIKRLVALSGEHVRIGNDRHLLIDGDRLHASTPGFENVYSFDPKDPPRRNHYSGHVNGAVARQYQNVDLSNFRYFPDESAEYVVPTRYLLAMGDNTMNSHDGRAWGAVPQEKLVGRASFVFWPITERFGWGYR